MPDDRTKFFFHRSKLNFDRWIFFFFFFFLKKFNMELSAGHRIYIFTLPFHKFGYESLLRFFGKNKIKYPDFFVMRKKILFPIMTSSFVFDIDSVHASILPQRGTPWLFHWFFRFFQDSRKSPSRLYSRRKSLKLMRMVLHSMKRIRNRFLVRGNKNINWIIHTNPWRTSLKSDRWNFWLVLNWDQRK